MNFKDLSLLKKVSVIIVCILVSPLILFCAIIGAIIVFCRVPFEYPAYKRSRYYKKLKQKYSIGITDNDSYRIINYLEKENIKYDSYDMKKDELIIGNTTYLFPWFECISFNEEGKCIISEQDNYDYTLLSEEPKVKGRKNIKLLISEEYFEKQDLELAREDKILLLYTDISEIGSKII